jgi:hypothetical protein
MQQPQAASRSRAACARRCCAAVGYRTEVAIAALQPGEVHQAHYQHLASTTLSSSVTALCWAAFSPATDPSSPWHLQRTLHINRSPEALTSQRSLAQDGDALQPPQQPPQLQPPQQQPQRPPQQQRRDEALQHQLAAQREDLEECLLAGTSDGFLHLVSLSGVIVFQQRIHSAPLQHIQCRTHTQGLHAEVSLEDITLTFPDSVVRVTALDLRATLRSCKLASATSVPVPALAYQRWELAGARAA